MTCTHTDTYIIPVHINTAASNGNGNPGVSLKSVYRLLIIQTEVIRLQANYTDYMDLPICGVYITIEIDR